MIWVDEDPPYVTPWAAVEIGDGYITKALEWYHDEETFAQAAVNDVLDEYLWENRVHIDNCNGAPQQYGFSQHLLQEIKDGTYTWKLVEVPP